MLPFLAGLVVGALGVSAVRSGRAGQALHQMGDQLRDAARSGQALTREVLGRVAPEDSAPPDEPPAAPPRTAARKRTTAKRATAKRAPGTAKKTAP
jgi:hypothetical protein